MDHNREASQHLTSFLQLFFWSVRLGQGHCFFASEIAPGPISGSFKLAAARHRQSWVVKTWQKPRWGKAGKEEKLNKTTMPHISVFKKPRETCQMGSCSHGMFFATIPYRFRYRFVIVLVTSARSHFRSPCKRLRATKHMRLSKLVQSHGAVNICQRLFSIAGIAFGGSLSLHSVLCKFLTPENSTRIGNIPDRVLTVPHIMYVYIYEHRYRFFPLIVFWAGNVLAVLKCKPS